MHAGRAVLARDAPTTDVLVIVPKDAEITAQVVVVLLPGDALQNVDPAVQGQVHVREPVLENVQMPVALPVLVDVIQYVQMAAKLPVRITVLILIVLGVLIIGCSRKSLSF